MRLKVPELIRHFDDNLRPKASNCSIVLWTLLRPKASNLRVIQYRFGTEAPKSVVFVPKILLYFGRCCAQKRRIQYRFGTEAPKSVEFAPKILLYFGRCCAQKRRICDEFNIDSELKRPKASNLRLKSYCTLDAVAPKSVEFAPKSYYTLGPKLLLYYLLEAIYNFISIYR